MGGMQGQGAIWVTGAAGFIGQNLVTALAQRGDNVVGFGRTLRGALPTGLVDFIAGDLSVAGFDSAMNTHGAPAQVYHLAGGSTVGASIFDPMADFENSVHSTARLMDFLRRNAVDAKVILASSAAVYGGGHAGPIGLDARTDPFSPYGHHKLMAEHLGLGFAQTYGMRVSILRLFSIYGPLINKQLIHDICTRLASDASHIELGGTGKEARDWCHVADVTRICLDLAPAPAGKPVIYNVGTARAVPIAQIAALICAAWGKPVDITFSGKSRPGDPFSLVAAAESLPPHFAPSISVEQGLQDFVAWFRSARGRAHG